MHIHTYIYIYIYTHKFTHTYIYIYIGVGIWGRLLGQGFLAVKRWCPTQNPVFSKPRPRVGLLQHWYPGYIQGYYKTFASCKNSFKIVFKKTNGCL